MEKRGEGLSLNFIIVAILALIALIVIALFFTGGITKLFGTEQEVSELSLDPNIRALSVKNCELYCTNQNENAFLNPSLPQQLIDLGITSCAELLEKDFDQCVSTKSCQKDDPESAISCAGLSKDACGTKLGCSWK